MQSTQDARSPGDDACVASDPISELTDALCSVDALLATASADGLPLSEQAQQAVSARIAEDEYDDGT